MILASGGLLLGMVNLLVLALAAWALIDAATRPAAAFPAAGKLTKPIWLAILVVAVVITYVGGLLGLGLVGTVAAVVYLVDVRPAVRGMHRGGP